MRYDRRHPGTHSRVGDRRQPAQIDRDRILYSSSLRRLAVITQVVPAPGSARLHNRLTHTLKVAHVGRRLAERLLDEFQEEAEWLGGLDPDVVEAACLAHDLGHPPFGHVAEKKLDELARRHKLLDGFEGNAQSFRILTKLDCRAKNLPGLDLTRASLAAVLKYPWKRGKRNSQKKKWGAYDSESEDLDFAREAIRPFNKKLNKMARSLEAEVMDWADDIAYALHDMEDFYQSGQIPLGEFNRDSGSPWSEFLSYAGPKLQPRHTKSSIERGAQDFVNALPFASSYDGSLSHYISLKEFISTLTNGYISRTKLNSQGLEVPPLDRAQVELIKQLTWKYVIEQENLALQQHGHRRIIEDLFQHFFKRTRSTDEFPARWRSPRMEKPKRAKESRDWCRLCLDMIASLTEAEAIAMHRTLAGA